PSPYTATPSLHDALPILEGLSTGTRDATEGNSVVTIGFPLGYDTPMEGEGNDFMAKSTLNPGTVAKRTSTVLQIDSYAAHGSSGDRKSTRLNSSHEWISY